MIRIFATWAVLAVASAVAQASPLGPDGQPGYKLAGKFIWFDLATDDPAGARAFYGSVFGWRFREVDRRPAPYTLIEHGAGKIGGMFRQARPQGAPIGSRWLSLISVKDVEAAARYVRHHGGQVVLAPVAVPGRGTHALFRDPQGAYFGVMASEGDPPDEPVADGDVFWVDLFARNPEQAAAFYAGLAGYDIDRAEALAGRKRWTLATGEIARAGVWALKADTDAPGWLPYILVDNVAATLARARAAGGKVVVGPRSNLLDGNLAVIADPNGGLIGVVNWVAPAAAKGALQ